VRPTAAPELRRGTHRLPEIRQSTTAGASAVGVLTGYAAVFDEVADLRYFKEQISPNAFDRALRERHDVRALLEHDTTRLLGRTANGTLRLRVDAIGLLFELDLADTSNGRDVAALVRRRDVSGMSIAFRVLNERVAETPEGESLRELLDLVLIEISVTAFPAYESTSVDEGATAGNIRHQVAAEQSLRLRRQAAAERCVLLGRQALAEAGARRQER
jgi:hypothetical protein